MKKQQAGMTLIELVIVIIVLGIIAAVAAPKFADIKGNAATAAKEGTVGAVDSAYTIATAKSQGAPTIDVMMTQMVGLTCDTTNFDTCVSADKDGDGKIDVEVLFYTAAACTTATGATGAIVTGYNFKFNEVAEVATDCRDYN